MSDTVNGQAWAIVLAGGSGTRLGDLTTDDAGETVPKQYCSLDGRTTLIGQTLQRAETVIDRNRVTAIVADAHRRYWEPALQTVDSDNIVVQPRNRGTALGILLPALRIAARDPDARILILPSDHYVAEEAVLERSMRDALNAIQSHPTGVALLGIEADEADPELGYIVPEGEPRTRLRQVHRFVEKPTIPQARQLIRDGALWNSFILVGRARSLIHLISQRYPDVVRKFGAIALHDEARLRALYHDLPEVDFSRHIATGQENRLATLGVPQCGWNDLGTPNRLAQTLARRSKEPSHCLTRPRVPYNWINLAERLVQVHPALAQEA